MKYCLPQPVHCLVVLLIGLPHNLQYLHFVLIEDAEMEDTLEDS